MGYFTGAGSPELCCKEAVKLVLFQENPGNPAPEG